MLNFSECENIWPFSLPHMVAACRAQSAVAYVVFKK